MSLVISGQGRIEGLTSLDIAGAINASAITTLASDSSVAIGEANSNTVYVTGTVPISGYDIVAAGIRRTVIYTSAVMLIHNSVTHIVRGGVNKTTSAGDSAEWMSLGGGNWFMLDYCSAGSTSVATLAGTETLINKKIGAVYILDKTVSVPAATGTVTLDLAVSSVFNLTLTGDCTLSLTNVPVVNGETLSIVVAVSQGATAYSLTWFNGLTWRTLGGAAPPAPGANKTTEYVITSTSSGSYIGRKGAAT